MDGGAADGCVVVVLRAGTACPQSCCLGCSFGFGAGPLLGDVFDVVKGIKDCEWVAQECWPPCVWKGEQPWCGVSFAGICWWEEHIVAVADGVFGCRGAGVVGE